MTIRMCMAARVLEVKTVDAVVCGCRRMALRSREMLVGPTGWLT